MLKYRGEETAPIQIRKKGIWRLCCPVCRQDLEIDFSSGKYVCPDEHQIEGSKTDG